MSFRAALVASYALISLLAAPVHADPKDVPSLEDYIQEQIDIFDEGSVADQKLAVQVLARLYTDSRALEGLVQAATKKSRDPGVRKAAAQALYNLPPVESVIQMLLAHKQTENWRGFVLDYLLRQKALTGGLWVLTDAWLRNSVPYEPTAVLDLIIKSRPDTAEQKRLQTSMLRSFISNKDPTVRRRAKTVLFASQVSPSIASVAGQQDVYETLMSSPCEAFDMRSFVLQHHLARTGDLDLNPAQAWFSIEGDLPNLKTYLGRCGVNQSVLTQRLSVSYSVGSEDMDLIYRIRNRAEKLGGSWQPSTSWGSDGLDPEFYEIRQDIHNRNSPSVLKKTEEYLVKARRAGKSPQVLAEYEKLIEDLRMLYEGTSSLSWPFFKQAAVPYEDFQGYADLWKIKDKDSRIEYFVGVGKKVRKLKDARNKKIKDSATKGLRIEDADANHALGQSRLLNTLAAQLFTRIGSALEKPGSELDFRLIRWIIEGLYIEGLLSEKKANAFTKTLASIQKFEVDKLRDFLKHVAATAMSTLDEEYIPMIQAYEGAFPEAWDFTQEYVRSSLLLRLSQVIEKLGAGLARDGHAADYEAMSDGETCGTLHVVMNQKELNSLVTSVDDILVLAPGLEVTKRTPFGGLLSADPLTEGSHAVILCRNMDKPCGSSAALLEDAEAKKLSGKFVRLKVSSNGYELEAWDDTQAIAPEQQAPLIPLNADLSVLNIQDLNSDTPAPTSVGTKASNYGELMRTFGPEVTHDGMALPFSAYHRFVKYHGIQDLIVALDQDPEARRDPKVLHERLAQIRHKILQEPINPKVLDAYYQVITKKFGKKGKLRFRSSSNSEDLGWFSGAGLYESYGAKPTSKAVVAKMIKSVWASVWSDAAYQAREGAHIDHKTVEMGVLIHPSYSDELANGVAFTGTVEHPNTMQISSNFDNLAVTNPEKGALPEVVELSRTEANAKPVYIRRSNVKAEAPVLDREDLDELRTLLSQIHDHFGGKAMDIEFKVVKAKNKRGRKVMIKQVREYRPE